MLSFESSTFAPEAKLFFLGALAGAARAGAMRAGGAMRGGATRTCPGFSRPSTSISKAPIKSLGGLTVSPSLQKSTTTTNDNSTNTTVNYNS